MLLAILFPLVRSSVCGFLGQDVEITHLQLVACGCFSPQNNALKFKSIK